MSARPAAQSAPAVDGRPVLISAPLRPGFDRAALSRYGDEMWDLSPAVFRENARRCHVTVRFDVVADPMIAAALREYLYTRLNVERPGHRPVLAPASVRSAFNRARRFFAFVAATLGRCELGRVDQALVDRYAKALRSAGLRAIAVAQLLEVVFDLHALRDHLPTARLSFEPWPERSPALVAGVAYQADENRTPRIPEPIIAPLLAWSLRYIEVFAPDILAARAELTALEAKRDALLQADEGLGRAQVRERRRARLVAYFEQRRAESRGVPIWTTAHNGIWRRDPATGVRTPPINAHLLHLHVGVDAQSQPGDHLQHEAGAPDLIAAAVAELGVETGGMDTAISELPGAVWPWRPRFDVKTLVLEERVLQAACYVVCAYLTGMRDCEVQAMRFGCLQVTRSEDGVILRHRVRATAYKGRQARGEPAEWVTIAPVARAVEVLEQLSARMAAARGVDTLWPVLSKAGTKTHVSAEIVRQLNAFRDHLEGLFGRPGERVIPPAADGSPWRFTTRQFRRTIAWHIANRPFGTVAGMIQYKHASVAVFEGYAGSSRSGFRAEVEAERRLGQLDDILDYFDARRGRARLSGPAAGKVGRALDAAAETLGPSPAMIADRARLRVLLASTARTLHPGLLADCFFDPSTALCLASSAVGASAPVMPLCQPTRCPNACITVRHKPAWARAADDARELLREKRLSPAQRAALAGELARFETVLEDLGDV